MPKRKMIEKKFEVCFMNQRFLILVVAGFGRYESFVLNLILSNCLMLMIISLGFICEIDLNLTLIKSNIGSIYYKY